MKKGDVIELYDEKTDTTTAYRVIDEITSDPFSNLTVALHLERIEGETEEYIDAEKAEKMLHAAIRKQLTRLS